MKSAVARSEIYFKQMLVLVVGKLCQVMLVLEGKKKGCDTAFRGCGSKDVLKYQIF